jgi:hypothetical protein
MRRLMTSGDMNDGSASRGRAAQWAGRLLYWLAVGVVSIALVIGFVLLLESLDGATLGAVATVRG